MPETRRIRTLHPGEQRVLTTASFRALKIRQLVVTSLER